MSLPIVVLSGGKATRLYPLTERIPKSLILINDIPFVLHQLNLFQKNNIDHVHFCLGHFGEMVKEVIDRSTYPNSINISYSYDGETLLGTGGAIKNALSFLPETFFVTYGDSFLDINYQLIETKYFEIDKGNSGLMTVYKNLNEYDTSNIIFEDSTIVLYSKKDITSRMQYIDYGLGILKKIHFEPILNKVRFDLADIYEKLSKEGNLIGYELQNRFYEIGSIQGMKDLSNYLKK